MVTKHSKCSSVTRTSAPPISPRGLSSRPVTYSRLTLLAHCKKFVGGTNALKLRDAVITALTTFNEFKVREKRTTRIGEQIHRQQSQRRRKRITGKQSITGRPRQDVDRLLVSDLASAFSCWTGCRVTQNRKDDPKTSLFETFAKPILLGVKVSNPHGKITDHIKRRNNPSTTFSS